MKKGNFIKNKVLIVILFLITILTTKIFAQDVPANLQAALFKKIFAFDKTLQTKGIEVAVLGGGDEMVAAFKDAGVNVKASGGGSVPGGVSVVYVAGGASVKSQTASKGVLSITGDVASVEAGKVAIGIGTEGGKPKIVINLAQSKAEGQELSADLLKIARVIQ
jgi:hypothetical protein